MPSLLKSVSQPTQPNSKKQPLQASSSLSDDDEVQLKTVKEKTKTKMLSKSEEGDSDSKTPKTKSLSSKTETKKAKSLGAKLESKSKRIKTVGATKHAPKAARVSYNFFCIEKKDELKKTGLKPNEIFKKCAELWNELSEDEKTHYKDLAKDDKIRFREEFEQFEREWPEEALALEQKKADRKIKRQSKPGKGASGPKGTKQDAKSSKLPKARSAYIIFSVAVRDSVKAAKQGISFGDITRKIAEMWKALPVNEKASFYEQAKAEKVKADQAKLEVAETDDVSPCKADEPDNDGFSSRMTEDDSDA